MAFALSSARKRLTRAGAGPDSAVIGPSGKPERVGPSADAGKEMALVVSGEVARAHVNDASLVNVSARDEVRGDEVSEPLSGIGVNLVIVGSQHLASLGVNRISMKQTMRKITDHIANPVNDRIDISVMDEPGAGGAHHHYAVDVDGSENGLDIHFQNGAIAENGVNGVTQEVLLAVVIDRLRCFQAGPFNCKENASALLHSEAALDALKSRTMERMARGVEGKSVA